MDRQTDGWHQFCSFPILFDGTAVGRERFYGPSGMAIGVTHILHLPYIASARGLFGNTYTTEQVEGLNTGERVKIDWAVAIEFQGLCDAKYGKLISDFFGRTYKFKPGTDRASIPVYDLWSNEIGTLGEEGFHRSGSDSMRHMS
jgi:hypothetical protein